MFDKYGYDHLFDEYKKIYNNNAVKNETIFQIIIKVSKMTKIIFKCEICRQVYILRERPSNCPFCGSFEEHVKPVEDVIDIEEYKLTEISRDNLSIVLTKEAHASNFYEGAKLVNQSSKLSKIFYMLKIHESWHHFTLSSEIKDDVNVSLVKSVKYMKLNNTDEENKRTAMIAEADAIVNYKKYLEEATEPRVKMVFAALLEVEQMHLDLIG